MQIHERRVDLDPTESMILEGQIAGGWTGTPQDGVDCAMVDEVVRCLSDHRRGHGHPADPVAGLDHEDVQTLIGQVVGRNQPVVTGADHDHVVGTTGTLVERPDARTHDAPPLCAGGDTICT